MNTENKHQLTEKLKVIENEIYDDKMDLLAINSKLEMAYKYEDELAQRMNAARLKTEELRKDFFKKSSELYKKFEKMKNIFDVWTGNFHQI